MNVIPSSFRKPCIYFSAIDLRNPFTGNRHNQKLAAEHILIFYRICPLFFRIIIIHWRYHRHRFFVTSVIHGIQIRNHLMTVAKCISHSSFCFFLESPWLFSVKFTAGAVETHNRRINSVLRPACFHFIILIPQHVTADIMAPPAVTYIGRSSRKIWLEIQRFPRSHRITGESDGITMAAGSCIP